MGEPDLQRDSALHFRYAIRDRRSSVQSQAMSMLCVNSHDHRAPIHGSRLRLRLNEDK
jgi:hypothetical protein